MLGARTYTPADDFFDEVVTLFIALASFNTATEAFTSLRTTIPTTQDHTPVLAGRVVHAKFPIHGLMHTVVRNQWPKGVTVTFETGTNPLGLIRGVQLRSANIANTVSQLVGTAYLKYYERNSHRPKAAFGTNQKTWPDLWRFAWLVRNAIAHKDLWAINDLTLPSATWHGLTVGPADNGKAWFDPKGYIAGGDVLILLEELDADAI